jgi:hypothetical protein
MSGLEPATLSSELDTDPEDDDGGLLVLLPALGSDPAPLVARPDFESSEVDFFLRPRFNSEKSFSTISLSNHNTFSVLDSIHH